MSASKQNIASLLSEYPTIDRRHDIHGKIEQLIQSQSGGYYIALNPEKIFQSKKNEHLKEILKNAQFTFIDGVGAKWAYEFLLNRKTEVISGVDLLIDIVSKQNDRVKIGFFGAEPSVSQKAREVLQKKWPKANIVFALNGFEPDRMQILKTIEEHQPNIVFVALGSPAQEEWIYNHYRQFPQVLFTGVGGSFDVISGKIQRAPEAVRKLGLEWLYRFLREPFKRWKRMMVLARFVFLTLKNKVF